MHRLSVSMVLQALRYYLRAPWSPRKIWIEKKNLFQLCPIFFLIDLTLLLISSGIIKPILNNDSLAIFYLIIYLAALFVIALILRVVGKFFGGSATYVECLTMSLLANSPNATYWIFASQMCNFNYQIALYIFSLVLLFHGTREVLGIASVGARLLLLLVSLIVLIDLIVILILSYSLA